MSDSVIAALIGGGISLLISLVTVAFTFGRLSQRVTDMQSEIQNRATRDEVLNMARDLAEIKGMFKLTLKDGYVG